MRFYKHPASDYDYASPWHLKGYRPSTPDAIDFACSETYRRGLTVLHGGTDPGPYEAPQRPADRTEGRLNDLEALVAQPGSVARAYEERLEQLRGEVKYLERKLQDILMARAKAKQPKRGKLTGIDI